MKCKKKKIFKFFCFLIAFLTLVASLYFSSDRIVVDYAVKCFDSAISSASYYAVDVIVDKKYRYADLVDVKTDKDGQISMVVTDSYEVNRLSTTVATNAFNTNMTFENASMFCCVNPGELPVLIESIQCDVALATTRTAPPKVYALHLDGTRFAELPCKLENGKLVLSIDTSKLKNGTPFFEIRY